MSVPLFRPSRQAGIALAAVALAALGYAFYLRYRVIEQSSIGIACEGGAGGFLCMNRRAAITLYNASLFGWVAAGAAALNLLRPSVLLCALALLAAGFGIVLYNVALSALAVALLILSLARRAPEPE